MTAADELDLSAPCGLSMQHIPLLLVLHARQQALAIIHDTQRQPQMACYPVILGLIRLY